MKYHLIVMGCQMNTADAEEMAQPLKERGLIQTPDLHSADVAIMNTCTVREHAEHKALSNLGRLRPWKRENPDRILIVAGCAASLWGDSLKKKFPYVDLVSPATQIEQFPEAIAKVLKDRWNWHSETEAAFRVPSSEFRVNGHEPETRNPKPETPSFFGDSSTAYVTIMRGCNYSCSYCIVPQVRGREKYRAMPDILEEIRQRVREGKREIMLLGQTVNSYYYRPPHPASGHPLPMGEGLGVRPADFADLLRAVNSIEGVDIIRFMSPHPRHMKDRVIQAMAECKKVARHVHLPVQSGSTRLLAGMKRLYSREEYLDIISKLRAAIPEIQITTDIIVGYPGETSSDFEETRSLIQNVRFNGLFAFKYSPRPGTDSANIPDDVPEDMKEDRLQQILSLNLAMNIDKRTVAV